MGRENLWTLWPVVASIHVGFDVSCAQVTDGEVNAMDREECPVAVGAASYAAEADFPEGQTLLTMDRDAHEPVGDNGHESAPAPTLCAEPAAPADEITPAQVLESLLFASDAPLSAGRLAELAGTSSARAIPALVDALNEKYAAAGLTFRIEQIARGYQMLSLPEYRPWLAKLNQQRSQTRLTPAALETLAIVAYKQPVIRADIEAIRGVACGEVLNRLREMNLVRIAGRAEIVGRPMLYGTTRKFLDVFGLADLDDLPPMEALTLRPARKPPADVVVEPLEPPLAAAGA